MRSLEKIDHVPRRIEDNPLYQKQERGEAALIDLYEKRVALTILCGPPGCGKTALGENVAKRYGTRWLPESPGTKIGLIDTIIEHRNKFIIPLDDCDWMVDDLPSINVLKGVTEIGKPRYLQHTVGGGKARKRVRIHAGIALNSNRDFDDPKFSASEHVRALKERATIVRFSFDPLDQYEYTCWLCSRRNGVLSNVRIELLIGSTVNGILITPANHVRRLKLDEGNDVLAHFAEYATYYPSLSPRTLVKFAVRRIGRSRDEWLELIREELHPKPQRVFYSADGRVIDKLRAYVIQRGDLLQQA